MCPTTLNVTPFHSFFCLPAFFFTVPIVHATLCMNPYEPAAHTAVLVPGSGLMCPGHSRPVATGTYADTIHVCMGISDCLFVHASFKIVILTD